MTALQNLAIFVIAAQLLASALLMLGWVLDRDTFERISFKGHPAIPGLVKTVGLFRNTRIPLMMALYFLALVFLVFSYAGAIMIVMQLFRLLVT